MKKLVLHIEATAETWDAAAEVMHAYIDQGLAKAGDQLEEKFGPEAPEHINEITVTLGETVTIDAS